jgi:hypothetical protein
MRCGPSAVDRHFKRDELQDRKAMARAAALNHEPKPFVFSTNKHYQKTNDWPQRRQHT